MGIPSAASAAGAAPPDRCWRWRFAIGAFACLGITGWEPLQLQVVMPVPGTNRTVGDSYRCVVEQPALVPYHPEPRREPMLGLAPHMLLTGCIWAGRFTRFTAPGDVARISPLPDGRVSGSISHGGATLSYGRRTAFLAGQGEHQLELRRHYQTNLAR